MEQLIALNSRVNDFAWGPVMLLFFLFTGILLSIKTCFMQLRLRHVFKATIGSLFHSTQKAGSAGLTPFQAMTTALAGAVGTGNIAGVAGAIFAGGAGAVFWMWVSAFFGMCTKYAEIVLAVSYRRTDENGAHFGGPMYYIEDGLGSDWRWLAVLFAALGAAASFGIGNIAQSCEISAAAAELFDAPPCLTGAFTAVLVGIVVLGGVKRIGAITAILVPLMLLFYLLAGIFIIVVNIADVPAMAVRIVRSAFTLKAAGGGVFGCGVMCAVRQGFARGIFSNEAGLGSAPIAHAPADTDEPCEQAMWGIFEVFADTIVICSITAFALLLSGVADTPAGAAGFASGGAAAAAAFAAVLPGSWGGAFIALSMIFFAFSSIICWCYYGDSCITYLSSGSRYLSLVYKMIFSMCCFFGATGSGKLMWEISDTLNGLMAIPNLIALVLLSGTAARLTSSYLERKS